MQAFKFFISVILLFLLLDFYSGKVLQHLFQKTRTGMSGGKINYLFENYENVDILAVGNSRCAHHIDPMLLAKEKVYNLSHNGMSLSFQTGLIDEMFRQKKIHVDTILLHLDIDDFFKSDKRLTEDLQHLRHYYHMNGFIQIELIASSRTEGFKQLFQSYAYNGKTSSIILNYLKTMSTSAPENGYISKKATDRDSINVVWHKNKMNTEASSTERRFSFKAQNYIEHLDSLCKANGCYLILFTSPYYDPSFELLERASLVESYLNAKNLAFFNYINLYNIDPQFKNIWIWNDAAHLNENGASLLTQIVRQNIDAFKYKTP
jgi:hypothetical protein